MRIYCGFTQTQINLVHFTSDDLAQWNTSFNGVYIRGLIIGGCLGRLIAWIPIFNKFFFGFRLVPFSPFHRWPVGMSWVYQPLIDCCQLRMMGHEKVERLLGHFATCNWNTWIRGSGFQWIYSLALPAADGVRCHFCGYFSNVSSLWICILLKMVNDLQKYLEVNKQKCNFMHRLLRQWIITDSWLRDLL